MKIFIAILITMFSAIQVSAQERIEMPGLKQQPFPMGTLFE